ncbi:hypothetical protein D3C81_1829810 [compost metagenome]
MQIQIDPVRFPEAFPGILRFIFVNEIEHVLIDFMAPCRLSGKVRIPQEPQPCLNLLSVSCLILQQMS